MSNRISNEERISRGLTRYSVSSSGCWEFTGKVTAPTPRGNRYGLIVIRNAAGQKRNMGAHRASYLINKGEIPPNYEVHHICENSLCINPDHLEAISKTEHRSNRTTTCVGYLNKRKTQCAQGHPFNTENTYFQKKKNGLYQRCCRACQAAKMRKLRLKWKTAGE